MKGPNGRYYKGIRWRCPNDRYLGALEAAGVEFIDENGGGLVADNSFLQ
jgi:hypothetical protein